MKVHEWTHGGPFRRYFKSSTCTDTKCVFYFLYSFHNHILISCTCIRTRVFTTYVVACVLSTIITHNYYIFFTLHLRFYCITIDWSNDVSVFVLFFQLIWAWNNELCTGQPNHLTQKFSSAVASSVAGSVQSEYQGSGSLQAWFRGETAHLLSEARVEGIWSGSGQVEVSSANRFLRL